MHLKLNIKVKWEKQAKMSSTEQMKVYNIPIGNLLNLNNDVYNSNSVRNTEINLKFCLKYSK